MKLYVNWLEHNIQTTDEFQKTLEDKTSEFYNNEDIFNDYLVDNFTVAEIFELDDQEKEQIEKEFEDKCRLNAETDLLADWEEIEIK